MKAFERREYWINVGKELERENTERERQRADNAEAVLFKINEELKHWKNLALGTTT